MLAVRNGNGTPGSPTGMSTSFLARGLILTLWILQQTL